MNLCELGSTGASADNWKGYSAGTNNIEIFSLRVFFWMRNTDSVLEFLRKVLIYFLDPADQGLWSTSLCLLGKGNRADQTYWLGLLYP